MRKAITEFPQVSASTPNIVGSTINKGVNETSMNHGPIYKRNLLMKGASKLLAFEPQTYFWSSRSDDRKYVCGSQATKLFT